MTSPSNSPPHSQPVPQFQNSTQTPQSPQTLALETSIQAQNHPNSQSDQNPGTLYQDYENRDHRFPDPSLSPQLSLSFRRPSVKRKKGSFHIKKQQAVEKKVQTLMKTLNPIPFTPSKAFDFVRHEELLKRLGLWDFVHIDFDKKIRTDVIAQLIVTYDSKARCGFVNGIRVQANRPVFGRAFNLPMRREKVGPGSLEPVVVDVEEYDSEVSAFLDDLLSSFMLLHGENWVVPSELVGWMREIKDGHPEKVDWAGMVWCMVEKELGQGVKLEDCYYASHLQYLVKSQKKEMFDEVENEVEVIEDVGIVEESVVVEEPNVELTLGQDNVEKLEVKDGERKEEETMVVKESGCEDDVVRGDWGLDGKISTSAHFLQRCNRKEEMDLDADEESKDDMAQCDWSLDGKNAILQRCNGKEEMDLDADEERKDDVTQHDWCLDGKKAILQRCNGKEEMNLDADEEGRDDVAQCDWAVDGKKATMAQFLQSMNVGEESNFDEEGERYFEEEGDEMKLEEDTLEEDEEDDEEFSVTPKIIGMRSDLDTNEIFYGVNEHFDDQSNMGIVSPMGEPYSSMGGPSFFGNSKKREMSDDHDLSHDPFGVANKRLRMDGSSSKPSDFDYCMGQIQLWVGKAREMYAEKEKEAEHFSNNQQMLMNEVQQRSSMIEHLHKTKYEDLQKKDEEINRLDRELYVMGNLINGYKHALKATQKDFSEYREKCQLPEEPIYKEVGPGGLVLSTMEIERNRLKREEEDRVNREILEQSLNSFEKECVVTFEGHFNRVQVMERKLLDQEKKFTEIKEGFANRKIPEALDSATPVDVDTATPVEVGTATPVEVGTATPIEVGTATPVEVDTATPVE